MLLTKVSRTYSKSINTKNYGIPESWIKIEATYEAQCESGDDPVKVSNMIYEQAKNDVIAGTNEVIQKINEARAAANTAPSTAVPPTAPAAPSTAVPGPRAL